MTAGRQGERRGRRTALGALAAALAVLAAGGVLLHEEVLVEWHLRRLRSEDGEVRVRSAEALAALGAARAIGPLLDALRDAKGDDTQDAMGSTAPVAARDALDAALSALIRKAPERSAPHLIERLEQGDDETRLLATWRLGLCGRAGTPAVPVLLRNLEGGDYGLSAVSAYALRDIGDPRALRPLFELMRRAEPVPALEARGWTTHPPLGGMGWPYLKAAFSRLIELAPQEAVPFLIDRLEQGDDPTRRLAAEGLAFCGRAAAPAVPILLRSLEEGDVHLRAASAVALGEIGDARALQPLFDAMCKLITSHDPSSWMMNLRRGQSLPLEAALSSLLQQIPEHAVPFLIERLEQCDENTRFAAVRSLALCGRAALPAVPLILRWLDEGTLGLRAASAYALVEIGDPGARTALEKAKADPDLRHYALMALGMLDAGVSSRPFSPLPRRYGR
jgi:HEAT repeat protein